jgi:hypothetical protein
LGSKIPTQRIEGLTGEEDSLAPFQGANAIPCPLGIDIEAIGHIIYIIDHYFTIISSLSSTFLNHETLIFKRQSND